MFINLIKVVTFCIKWGPIAFQALQGGEMLIDEWHQIQTDFFKLKKADVPQVVAVPITHVIVKPIEKVPQSEEVPLPAVSDDALTDLAKTGGSADPDSWIAEKYGEPKDVKHT